MQGLRAALPCTLVFAGPSLNILGLNVYWISLGLGFWASVQRRYDDAADAYDEGLKTSPGDAALARGLDDVLKAQASSKAPAGESFVPTARPRATPGYLALIFFNMLSNQERRH